MPLIFCIIIILSIIIVYIYHQTINEDVSYNQSNDDNRYPWKKYPLRSGDFLFPDDEGRHMAEKEWWYVNGHVTDENDRTYGYIVCFFDTGVIAASITDDGSFVYNNTSEFYSDFYIAEGKLDLQFGENRLYQIPNKPFDYKLELETDYFQLSLTLQSEKPPLPEGRIPIEDGYSYYYSQTDLNTTGYLVVNNNNMTINGKSWIDRQWGEWDESAGWEWFSIQLENDMEIMAYKIFDRETKYPTAQILFIMDSNNDVESFNWSDEMYNFRIEYSDYWASDKSGNVYSVGWEMFIPPKNIHLIISPSFYNQEMNILSDEPVPGEYDKYINLWEGNCRVSGEIDGESVIGNAYAESRYNYGSIKGDITVSDVDVTHLYENEYSIRIEIINDLSDPSEELYVKVFVDNPNYGGSTLYTYIHYALTNVTYIEDVIELEDSNIELFVIADPDNIIAETNEQNNMKHTEIMLHLDNCNVNGHR